MNPKEQELLVLIADDDLDILRMVSSHLRSQGMRVIVASDGEKALSELIVQRPDAVVLDVMMPILSGWEICKYIRSHTEYEGTAVVMLTAIGEQLNRLTSPLYGADDYLDKPFDLDDLTVKVAEAVRKRGGPAMRDADAG